MRKIALETSRAYKAETMKKQLTAPVVAFKKAPKKAKKAAKKKARSHKTGWGGPRDKKANR